VRRDLLLPKHDGVLAMTLLVSVSSGGIDWREAGR